MTVNITEHDPKNNTAQENKTTINNNSGGWEHHQESRLTNAANNIQSALNPDDIELVTFGCRLNIYESEVIKKNLRSKAPASADATNIPAHTPQTTDTSQKNPKVIIINSCAVTNEAVRQARQTVRKKRKEHPDAKIIFTGCAAQVEQQSWSDMKEIDQILGNQEKMNLSHKNIADWIQEVETAKHNQVIDNPTTASAPAINTDPDVHVTDIMQANDVACHLLDGFDDKTRAFIQIQQGCDHRCTFCIIPYARGPHRSVPIGHLCKQIQLLLDQGVREIVLTGVDMTSYGSDLPGTPTLGEMIKRLFVNIKDLDRLRLSSLDPAEVLDDAVLLDLILHEKRLMPHLHLSLQAGDNMILKRMKRRHLREDAIQLCEKIHTHRPEMAIGADIIAGFPTETDDMFENSLRIIDECNLVFAHIFPFSAKVGTPAARMPQLHGGIIKSRAKQLRDKAHNQLHQHLRNHVGSVQTILLEKNHFGRLNDFTKVKLTSINNNQDINAGNLITAKIIGFEKDYLLAELKNNK